MFVRVQYTTQLKAAIGQPEESVELPDGSTLTDLIELLADRHADPFRQFVLNDSNHLLPSILLCVNDEQVDIETSSELSDGSVVTFLSAISGG